MTDIDIPQTLGDMADRAEQCGMTSEQGLALGKNPEQNAAHMDISEKQLTCYQYGIEPSTADKMAGILKGAFDAVRTIPENISNTIKGNAPEMAERATGYGEAGKGGVTKSTSALSRTENYLKKHGL